jgi:hypothetical protein
VASQSSSARVREGLEALQVRVRHSAVRVISVAVLIQPAQPAQGSRRVQEWAEGRDCRLLACRPNRPDARVRLRGVQDSVISTGLKKVR